MFDRAKEFMLIKAINHNIKRIGHMLSLKIDPETKALDLTVLLVGEDKPLDISVKSYDFVEKDDKNFIKIGEVETSKTWLNILLSEYVDNGEIEITPKISKLLKLVM